MSPLLENREDHLKPNVVLTARKNGLNRREDMGTSNITQTWTWGWGPGGSCFLERLKLAAPLTLRDGPQAQSRLGQQVSGAQTLMGWRKAWGALGHMAAPAVVGHPQGDLGREP